MIIFVAKILWSTTHAPQNAYFGAPQKRFSLLVCPECLELTGPYFELLESGVVIRNFGDRGNNHNIIKAVSAVREQATAHQTFLFRLQQTMLGSLKRIG
jgi:hypothetical protein